MPPERITAPPASSDPGGPLTRLTADGVTNNSAVSVVKAAESKVSARHPQRTMTGLGHRLNPE